MHRLNVTVEYKNGDERDIEITVSELILFEWTGRDIEVIKKQTDELAQYNIKPKSIPEMYVVQPYLITTSNYVRKVSELHTGWVEYVILAKNEDEVFVSVGSDHSDLEVERCSVIAGKHLYPKVVARRAWPLEDVIDHWDELIIRSQVLEGTMKVPYQEAKLRLLLRPERIIEEVREVLQELRNTIIFSGTIPTLGGIKVSEYFELTIHDPLLNRSITHYYWID